MAIWCVVKIESPSQTAAPIITVPAVRETQMDAVQAMYGDVHAHIDKLPSEFFSGMADAAAAAAKFLVGKSYDDIKTDVILGYRDDFGLTAGYASEMSLKSLHSKSRIPDVQWEVIPAG